MKVKHLIYTLNPIASVTIPTIILTTLLVGCQPHSQTTANNLADNDTTDSTITAQDNAASATQTGLNDPEGIEIPKNPFEEEKLIDDDVNDVNDVNNKAEAVVDEDSIEYRLAEAIPTIEYSTDNLPLEAIEVNITSWYGQEPLDRNATIKIQALLNWHRHGVGAVDGDFGGNVIKAMQAFQQANNLPLTQEMNANTWLKLVANKELADRPVLVNYTLKPEDVYLPRLAKGVQYRSVKEALAEKFHMSQALLSALNKNKRFRAGEVITVYNPGTPNNKAVSKVVVDKKQNLLYAFDANENLVATYPTTVGSHYTPSPHGNYKVINRFINPTYNSNFRNKNSAIPPGPNNPVGRVWIGLSKQGFGIHGSPEPELISQQKSHGCVRLTNWDALALYSTIEKGAEVEFL